jgi:MYXO-CTERM domain-containing protein
MNLKLMKRKSMRQSLGPALALLSATMSVSGATILTTYNTGFANSGVIPDGSASPWSDTRPIAGTGLITGVSVQLEMTGGYNGDLYAYLSYGGVLVPLLDRVGVGTGNAFGYSDAGLNLRFEDSAANNIHFYRGVIGWSIGGGAAWQPDGRVVNPVTGGPGEFDAAGTRTLGLLNGRGPSGDWTLVVADVSSGGGATTVVSWGLEVTTVPEPGAWGIVAGLGLAAVALVRRRRP